ncbi:galactose-binding domain-containing protein [Aquimarina agarivorans]|uniref:galactose-binding domain-containing protein n=1 Tax=Aquimarina agarivorans TaxID=980584 RepID=UPI000248E804|nr:RICIN domain-containing protein [Aquimarina agarivorans]
MKNLYVFILLLSISNIVSAQRNDRGLNFGNTPLPTNLQNIASWDLIEAVSDDFNYANKQNPKFRSTWDERYNPDPGFTGPGQTRWNIVGNGNFRNDAITLNNGNLEIRAFAGDNNPGGRRNFTDRFVNCGIVTTKNTILYPVYMEARIQISNLENSSNFWMLNACDNEEIDVLECYGGAKLRDNNGNVIGGDETFYTTQMSVNQHIWHRQGVQNHGGETDNCGGRDLTDFTYQVFFNTSPTNSSAPIRNWRDDFHTFGALWTSPTEVFYYIDGVPRFNGNHYVPNRIANSLTGSFTDARLQCPNPAVLNCETTELLRDVQGRSSGGSAFPNREFNDPTFIILDTESHAGRPLESVANLNNNNLNAMKVDWVRVYRPTFFGTQPASTPDPAPVTVTPTPAPQPAPVASPTPVNNENAINLALNGTATQSSTLRTINASFANDGNTTNFSHTENNGAAWWEIDLGSINNISHINVWNREDCCRNRLQQYQIFVSDVPFVSTDIVATANQTGNGVYFQDGIAQRPTRQNIGRTGRYVRIQLSGTNFLNIAEIEVFGTPLNTANNPTPANNNSNQLFTNGLYQISNPFTNQSLLARALENHTARMVDTGVFADQRWELTHLGNNVYTIRNNGTGRYLEVEGAGCSNGSDVQTGNNATASHQQWTISQNRANYTLRPNNCLSRALDVAAGARDANVQIWFANNNNNNQRWDINPIFNANLSANSTLATDDVTDQNKVIVYPNPASIGENFSLEGLTSGNQINVLDSTGKLVKQLYANSTTETISTSNLTTGLYFISIDYGNQVVKLIVK